MARPAGRSADRQPSLVGGSACGASGGLGDAALLGLLGSALGGSQGQGHGQGQSQGQGVLDGGQGQGTNGSSTAAEQQRAHSRPGSGADSESAASQRSSFSARGSAHRPPPPVDVSGAPHEHVGSFSSSSSSSGMQRGVAGVAGGVQPGLPAVVPLRQQRPSVPSARAVPLQKGASSTAVQGAQGAAVTTNATSFSSYIKQQQQRASLVAGGTQLPAVAQSPQVSTRTEHS
jgi:hypothetical protein